MKKIWKRFLGLGEKFFSSEEIFIPEITRFITKTRNFKVLPNVSQTGLCKFVTRSSTIFCVLVLNRNPEKVHKCSETAKKLYSYYKNVKSYLKIPIYI